MERTYILTPDVQVLVNTLREVMKNQKPGQVRNQVFEALNQTGDIAMFVDFLALFDA